MIVLLNCRQRCKNAWLCWGWLNGHFLKGCYLVFLKSWFIYVDLSVTVSFWALRVKSLKRQFSSDKMPVWDGHSSASLSWFDGCVWFFVLFREQEGGLSAILEESLVMLDLFNKVVQSVVKVSMFWLSRTVL